MAQPRKRRSNGEVSRQRIIDAAAEVAGERGYEGTSINLVSERSGLPASSIYWHFKDKDELIAAVIETSFQRWLTAASLLDISVDPSWSSILDLARRVATALLDTPDFLRLGLMLALERRPEEPSARTMFLSVRAQAYQQLVVAITELAPHLDEDAVRLLATYTMAGADGLFVAKEIGGPEVDLLRLFELHARVVIEIASTVLAGKAPR